MENLTLDQAPLSVAAVNDDTLRVLNTEEINDVSGGFVCGGVCVLGSIGAGIAFFTGGLAVGGAFGQL